MAICSCGLPAHCCQPAVAGDFIYADFRSELSTHLAPRLCLVRVLLYTSCCYKLSPFQAHWGQLHCTHFLRPACLFTVHMGSGPSPLSCEVFFPPPLLQAFPLLVSGCVLLLLASLACLVYLQFYEWFPSPTLLRSGCPTLFDMCLFVVITYYSVSLFSMGGGRSVQGAMLISGPGLSVGAPCTT
jgi:hypothetical protein